MKLSKLTYILLTALMLSALVGCIEDGFTTSPSADVTFSTEKVDFGVVFTDEGTPTHRFVVYNRDPKSVLVSRIALSGENADMFRLNVDGFAGREFHDVEIRGRDSIYVFVEATLPPNGLDVPKEVTAQLDFFTNGNLNSVTLSATGRDAIRLSDYTLQADERFTPGRPYIVYGVLEVPEGVTLTLDPGTEMCFHDGSYMVVRGSLQACGTPQAEVSLGGDRTGDVITDVSFDIMSRQWVGMFFTATSKDNLMSHTHMRNTTQGLRIEGDGESTPDLTLINTRLRNSGDTVLTAVHARVDAYGCEFAEAAASSLMLRGGQSSFNHCTFANYYLFSALGGATVALAHLNADTDDDLSGLPYTRADFTNCIIYGNGTDISHGDLTGTDVTLRRCLLKSEGSDDDNFLDCLWGSDPMYYTVREDYYFDYRLRLESPARRAADPALTHPLAASDRYGLPRGSQPDLGAYVAIDEEIQRPE